jgi:hypothetical protein
MNELEPDIHVLRRIAAELRAGELVHALRSAVANAPRWRIEAARLLELIDKGIVPEPPS